MEIKRGDLKLKSDAWNYWIEQETEVQSGANKGKKTWTRVTGYHAKLPSLYKDFVETGVRSSKATNMKQVIAKINELLEQVERLK